MKSGEQPAILAFSQRTEISQSFARSLAGAISLIFIAVFRFWTIEPPIFHFVSSNFN
jgi:hypothetical protein